MRPALASLRNLYGPPPLVAHEPGSVSELLAELSSAADGFAARAALLTRTSDGRRDVHH